MSNRIGPEIKRNQPPNFEIHQISDDELQRIEDTLKQVSLSQSIFSFCSSAALTIYLTLQNYELNAAEDKTVLSFLMFGSAILALVSGVWCLFRRSVAASAFSKIRKRRNDPAPLR